jgi:predicted RNase H-like HicB family nuclease
VGGGKIMKRQFTAVYQKRGKWYIGYVEEIPGVNTQGRTLAETRRNLKEALHLVLEANLSILEKESKIKEIIKEPITV